MSSANKHIIWLASYPKSGNTWVRIFLKLYLKKGEEENDFGIMTDIPIASNRYLLDRHLGVPSSELSKKELQDLRPGIYREMARKSKEIEVLKVHDAFGCTSDGQALFPEDVTRAAIYIVRNPLDIVVSYARHSNITMEESVQRINNSEFIISDNTEALKAQVPQFLGSWSDHVNSWLKQDFMTVILLKYEDLLTDSRNAFRALIRDLELEYDEALFDEAHQKSSFKYLQKMENKHGFREKPIQAEAFFREGTSGYYIRHLDRDQIHKVVRTHQELMRTFGYITD